MIIFPKSQKNVPVNNSHLKVEHSAVAMITHTVNPGC